MNVEIYMYHYVRDYSNNKYSEIKGMDVREFENQIEFLLEEGYTFISISELEKINLKPRKKYAILTFDDGYKEHYTYVFPILKKYGIKGTFYVTSAPIKSKEMLNINRIHYILATSSSDDIYNKLIAELKNYNLYNNIDIYKEKYLHANRWDNEKVIFIKRMLQVGLPEDIRLEIAKKLFKQYVGDEKIFANELYLSPSEIKEMYLAGMDIGIHTENHLWLSSLDKEKQRYEITKNIEFLLDLGIEKEKLSICYPFGGYNDTTLSICKDLGIEKGVTTEARSYDYINDDSLQIPRYDCNDLIHNKILKFKTNFNKFENDLNLFDFLIQNIPFWQVIRVDIFYDLRRKIENVVPDRAKIVYENKERYGIYNRIKTNPFNMDKVDYLILSRGKRSKVEDEYIDIFTNDIYTYLNKNNNVAFIDFAYFGDYSPGFLLENSFNFEDLQKFKAMNRSSFNFEFSINELERLELLAENLYDKFNYRLNIKKVKAQILNYKVEYFYYKKFLKHIKPKKVIMSLFYRRLPFVQAATNLNIETIDIQYASINDFHPAYSFSHKNKNIVFPTRLMVWGEFFKESLNELPIEKDNVHCIGLDYYKNIRHQTTNSSNKREIDFIFLSQLDINKKMSKYAYQFALNNPHKKVVYKLHPGECGNWKRNIPYLLEAEKLENFKIIGLEENIHTLLANSIYQIGYFSSGIFEGILLGCKTFLLKGIATIEFEKLIKKKYAYLIDDEENFCCDFDNFYFNNDYNWFFNFNSSLDSIWSEINE